MEKTPQEMGIMEDPKHNEKNMTAAEKLADKLKTESFGSFFDDDDINSLTKTAIYKALFEPVVETDRFGSKIKHEPSIVVKLASEAFADAIKPIMENAVAELSKSEEFQKALMSAIMSQLPAVTTQFGYGASINALRTAHDDNLKRLSESIKGGFDFYPTIIPDPITG